MILRFEDWLNGQRSRDDQIGELARMPDMRSADALPSRRTPDEHKTWVNVVVRIADPRHIEVFNDAWQEFLTAKREAANDLD
jgi:hypothetical protein